MTSRGSGETDDEIPAEVRSFATLPEDRRTLLLQVSDFLDEIDYGTVVLVMHAGKITQIETSEKIRLSRGPSDGDDRPRSG